MRLFRNRPLCLCCAVYMAVSALGFCFNMTGKAILGSLVTVSVICVLIAALCGKLSKSSAVAAGVAAIFAISALTVSYVCFERTDELCGQYYGDTCEVNAVVTERKSSDSFYSVLGIKVYEINGERVNIKALLECDYECDLQPGYEIDAVLIGDKISALYGSGSAISFLSDGYRMLFIDDPSEVNADGTLKTNINVIDTEVKGLAIYARQLNELLSARLMSSLGNTSGRLASALLLGNKDKIPDAVQRDFKRSGISHILALSGMHLSILLGIFGFLLGKLGVGRTPKIIILCAIAPAYLVLTGCSVSAARAFIMVTVTYITSLIGGRSDTLTNLFLAGAVILMVSPFAVCDAAYWLSLFATLGIVVGSDIFSQWIGRMSRSAQKRKWLRGVIYITSALITGICANIAVTFFMWLYFGELSLLSPIITIAVTPMVYALIIISLVCFTIGSVPTVGKLLSLAASAISDMLIKLTHTVSSWDHATISLSYRFVSFIVIAMTLALVVMLIVRINKKILLSIPVLAPCLLFCVALLINNFDTTVSATYIQRNSMGEMLVFSSTDGAVVCDISDGSYSHLNLAADTIGKSGNTVTDVIILTHYHKKHVTSLGRYMNNYIVKQIWLPIPLTTDEYYIMNDILCRAEESEVSVVLYDSLSSESLSVFGDGQIRIEREYISRSVQPVIYITLESRGKSVAYIGKSASETSMWEKISKSIKSDEYVIFGNHGPNTKLRYDCSFDPSVTSALIFANESVAAYSRVSTEYSDVNIVCGPEKLTFKLN